jgi:hypothetical protein
VHRSWLITPYSRGRTRPESGSSVVHRVEPGSVAVGVHTPDSRGLLGTRLTSIGFNVMKAQNGFIRNRMTCDKV